MIIYKKITKRVYKEENSAKRPHDFESVTEHKPKKSGYEKVAKAFEFAQDYYDYVSKHGSHFTNELASYASSLMVNASGDRHCWTPSEVKKSMASLGLTVPEDKATLGDLTYLANMAFADLYPEVCRDEAACLKYAYKIANDPDGYEGMVFSRWCADVIGKSTNIDWTKFI